VSKLGLPERKLRIALLTLRLRLGFGVEIVVAEEVEYFVGRGYEVTLIALEKDDYYDARFVELTQRGVLRVRIVPSVSEALDLLRRSDIDIVIAHTPPFFSLLPQLPSDMLKVFFDYGEPPAELFADAAERKKIRASKMEDALSADLVISISQFIKDDSGIQGSIICALGNDHLFKRRSDLALRAGRFREAAELSEQFLVLNVTRYGELERSYKGIDLFIATKESLYAAHPELEDIVCLVVAGHSYAADRSWATSQGLLAFSNLSESALISAYLDADFYLTTSKWEGYNLGLAQALAFGLEAAASAEGAHPEFGIPVSNSPDELADFVYRAYRSWAQSKDCGEARSWTDRLRIGRRYPWKDSHARLERHILDRLKERRSFSPFSILRAKAVETRSRTLKQEKTLPAPPIISFLVLTKDRPDLLIPCIESIERHCNVPFELLVGDTGSTDYDTLSFYQNTTHPVLYLGFYNFSACNNVLAARAKGRWLVLINNDVEIIRADFAEVLDYMQRTPSVGTVGAYLVYKDKRIQHAGVRICPAGPYRGIPEHFDKFMPIAGYPGLRSPRRVPCVTGAFLVTSAENYRRFGGLDEVYQVEAQDADLCLRMMKAGLSNVVHPALLAVHHEGATRRVKESGSDREVLLSRHLPFIESEVYRWQGEQGL